MASHDRRATGAIVREEGSSGLDRERLIRALEGLYPGRGRQLLPGLLSLVGTFRKGNGAEDLPGRRGSQGSDPEAAGSGRFRADDSILITYGDMLRSGEKPLSTLARFCERRLAGSFSHLHILPFFPSSSDEGFSVMDFGAVDPRLGGWSELARLGRDFRLVFDLVLNHASAHGNWFRRFLERQEPFDRFFLTRPEGYDDSKVFRPRTHPLFTTFRRDDGSELRAWTTFSPDQVDLDYSQPEVLLAMLEAALNLVERGAAVLRLDAIAYAWKEDGSDCLDRPQVHDLVRLFRAVLDGIAPTTAILTETNLPQAINDAYFGQGDEAQLAYNFALPPLALHAFVSGGAGFLASWAAGLPRPQGGGCHLNFLSSHDGIGLTPVRGLLPPAEFESLVRAARARGSLVSERSTPEGPLPYELNTTFLDAIAPPGADDDARLRPFLSCHAAMAALRGIPAVYFHSLVGSRNWREGPELTGSRRSVHRERLDLEALETELDNPASLRSRAFSGLLALLKARRERSAFDPASPQSVLFPDGSGRIVEARPGSFRLDGPLFALLRGRGENAVLAVVNVSENPASCILPAAFNPRGLPFDPSDPAGPIGGSAPAGNPAPRLEGRSLWLPPLGTAWLDGSLQGA